MHKLPRPLLLIIAVFITVIANAQAIADTSDTEGVMRSSGKIYVVAAIVITILLGLFLYVMRLDKKISRLEKDN